MFQVERAPQELSFGRQGESNILSYAFDFSEWAADWPGGLASMTVILPNQTQPQPIPDTQAVVDGTIITLQVLDNLTAKDGRGTLIIRYVAGQNKKRSRMIEFVVEKGHETQVGSDISVVDDWVDEATKTLNDVKALEFTINEDGELLAGETVLGRVSDNPRGEYTPSADPLYSKRDIVFDNGGSYRYINDTPSNEPTSSTSHWQQIASIGGQDLVDAAVAARDAAQGYKDAAAAAATTLVGTVANGLTAKGASAYADLPTTGNEIGDYYYCSDGSPAGNYVWNGTAFYFGGTGDEGYSRLKSGLYQSNSDALLWEQGTITSGNNGGSATRIRTIGYISDVITNIKAQSDMVFALVLYINNTFVGYYNGSNVTDTISWISSSDIPSDYDIRVLARHNDSNAPTVVADASNIIFEFSIVKINDNRLYEVEKLNSYFVKSNNIFSNDLLKHGYTLNSDGAWGGSGTNESYDIIGYIPCEGLESITVALINFTPKGTATYYCFYDANKVSITGRIQGFPIYGEAYAKSITVPTGAHYLAIRILKTAWTNNSRIMIQSGSKYTGWEPYGDYPVSPVEVESAKVGYPSLARRLNVRDAIYVAAVDSEEKYRNGADYICSGVNDEVILQEALLRCGVNGTLYLAPGNYVIDSFSIPSDGSNPYVLRYDCEYETRVKIKAYEQPTNLGVDRDDSFANCAILNISQACYDALDSNITYSIICAEPYAGITRFKYTSINVEGVAILVPGNQKKIVAFDGTYASSVTYTRCGVNMNNGVTTSVAVDGCIGFKATSGSNMGTENRIDGCRVYGCAEGFHVSGEHLVLITCTSNYCKYGYTFNKENELVGGHIHPNTLISCCSQFDFNFPYFGKNPSRQAVTLIDFNMEFKQQYFDLGGNYATEETSGVWRGSIEYTIKGYAEDNRSGNQLNLPFWANGSGINMKSQNNAQKHMVTTLERTSYSANQMQRVYDTDEMKFYTYIGDAWVAG